MTATASARRRVLGAIKLCHGRHVQWALLGEAVGLGPVTLGKVLRELIAHGKVIQPDPAEYLYLVADWA